MLLGFLAAGLISLSVTVQPTAMAYHGIASSSDLQNIKKRGNSLDQEGRLTYHHSIGATLRTQYFQTSANYFRNSVNQNAGSLMAGPKIDLWKKNFTLGIVGGVYLRDPIEGMKIPGSVKTLNIEIAPMVMLTASVAVRIYKSLFFEVIAGSNYILSFFTPGIRVDI